MKPGKIFLFYISLFLALVLLSYLNKGKSYQLPGGVLIKIPDISSLLFSQKPEYADISEIITYADSSLEISSPPSHKITSKKTAHHDTVRANSHQLIQHLQPIEYPPDHPDALNHFFEALSKLSENHQLIRIIHYGDSQIEGDRVSSGLRNKLQMHFGGGGPGLFPVVDVAPTITVKKEYSSNWLRFSILNHDEQPINHKKYGALLSFCRFTPYPDSSFTDTTLHRAEIILQNSRLAYSSARSYNQLKIFYGYNPAPFIIRFYKNDDELLETDTIPALDRATAMILNFEHTPEKIKMVFEGVQSPDIYALALDKSQGVAVDNVPLRGSAGLDFTKTNLDFLSRMYRFLNVKLLIFEFGVNVVPNVVKNYRYYENWLYSNLAALKSHNPEIDILVVGVSDVARKNPSGTYYESYPNIELIRDAMKKAAFRAHCAFWDLYLAMGGKNSMPSWVFANPPLANKDFTHFTPRGANIVASMLYNALINDYQRHLSNEN